MNEAQLRGEIDRAHRAERLLADDLIREALKAIRDRAHNEFTTSAINDDRARLVARLRVDVAEDFIASLSNHVATGRMAKTTLEEILTRAKRAVGR